MLWTFLLVLAGDKLGEQYGQVARVVESASNLVLGLAVAWYLWHVVTFGRKQR